jgi:hypothetical protein
MTVPRDASAVATLAWAEFPEKPVTLVVPFAAGGPSERSAARRAEGPDLIKRREALGVSVVPTVALILPATRSLSKQKSRDGRR